MSDTPAALEPVSDPRGLRNVRLTTLFTLLILAAPFVVLWNQGSLAVAYAFVFGLPPRSMRVAAAASARKSRTPDTKD